MKVIVDKYADSEGVSSAEWIREAIQQRIERESDTTEKMLIKNMDELQAYVEKAVAKAIENKLNQTEK